MKSSNDKSISDAILNAMEANDTETSMELMELWDSKIQRGMDASLNYYYTKLQVLLKCYEQTKDVNAKIRYLHDTIETGNKFFVLNEVEGFPMDAEVQTMWLTLVDTLAKFVSFYLEGPHEDDSECDDCEEEDVDSIDSSVFYAILAGIGTINMPNLKP